MNTLQKVGAGLAVIVASAFSTGNLEAQQPFPNRIVVTQQKEVAVPYTTWTQTTSWVPQTTWTPQTQYRQAIVQEQVIYKRVDHPIRRCCIGEFLEGALSAPFCLLNNLTEPLREPCERRRPIYIVPAAPCCQPQPCAPAYTEPMQPIPDVCGPCR